MTAELKTRLTLDTSEAQKSAKGFAGAVDTTVKDAAAKVNEEVKGWKAKLEEGKEGALKVAIAVGSVVAAAASAYATIKTLSGVIDTIQTQIDVKGRANFFGATEKDAEMLRGKLDDVKNGLQATALAADLASNGFKSIDMARFADAINVFSALTGQTKQAMEDMLRAGELSDQTLKIIGRTRQEADLVIAKASIAAGGRELTAMEKTRALLSAFGKDIKRVNDNLGDIGRSNPFNVLARDIETMWGKVVHSLRPAIDDLVQTVSKNREDLVKFFKMGAEAAIFFVKNLTVATKGVSTFVAWVKEGYGAFFQSLKSVEQRRAEAIEASINAEFEARKKAQEALKKQAEEAAKKQAEASGKVQQDERKRQLAARIAQAKLEAAEEIRARMAEARTMVRNFAKTLAEASGMMGGPVAGVISAMKDSFEKTDVLRAAYGKLIDEFERGRLQQEKLGKTQARVITLYSTFRKAGSLALKEYVFNETAATEALKAQNEQLASNAKLTTSRIERLNLEKNLVNAMAAANMFLQGLEAKRKKEGGKDPILDQQIAAIKQLQVETKKLADARRQALVLLEQTAKIEAGVELETRTVGFYRATLAARDATKALQLQLGQLNMTATQGDAARQAAATARQTLLNQQIDNLRRIEELEARIALKGQSEANLKLMNSELTALKAQNREIERQDQLQKDLLATQLRLLTVGGAALAQLGAQAQEVAQKIGQTVASSTMSLVNSLGGAISTLFEQLVTADKNLARNFGKAILSALGDMAIAFANTFAAVGVGRIALGDVVGGAGLAAAAVALYAVAGTLKGLGAVVGTAPTPVPSQSAAPATTLPGQQVERPKEQRNTYVLISGFLGSEQEQFRKFKQWQRKNERAVGA